MLPKRRAFSLLEAVFTLFTVFLLLGLCGDLFKQYSTSTRFSATQASNLAALQTALQSMIDDSRQATSFITPNSVGQSSPFLLMVQIDPKNLNTPLALSSGANIMVKYYLSDGTLYPSGTLLRESISPSNTTIFKVAESVQGMNIVGLGSWSTPGDTGLNAVQIQLALQENERVLVISECSLRPPF